MFAELNKKIQSTSSAAKATIATIKKETIKFIIRLFVIIDKLID
jgi:hypothetical protein